jgi:class 3 adenylate cyclase/tetratricopeptide (TPR) repeat protein
MQCPRCRAENRDGLRFCEDCGSRLTLTCVQCGGDLAPGKRFCGSCGTPATDQSAARTPSPESYTPKHLAERILTSRAALEGERKQVTVLFADLKGSMELLADRDPEEARKLLDPVLERMMEAVHRYEGTVNQVMGDGIMALFGAPVAHEDHAVRACYAAIDLQRSMRRLREELRRAHGVTVEVRVGLNSGEVVVRAISSDLHMDYTAVGQTTHLAARMEQLASPGTTLVTADTLRLAEGYVEVKPLGPMPVKGLPAPVETYELTGGGPRRSRLTAAAAQGLTRFAGRDAELEQLREALGRTASGHGQVVAIVGEPGVGKSRLVWEVTHSHRTHGWLILQGGSVSYGKATPYLPVVDLLKGYLQIADRDEARAIREKVTGKLLTLDRTLEPALSAFLALLDVPVEDSRWEALDPPARRQRTIDALRRLLLRESQAQPLLVIFEDLHWIDAETQAVLDRLVESLPTARVLLLVNYRPEYRHGWGGKTYYRQLRLDPLPPERAAELLETLLGGDAGLDPLRRLLLARTEGNPLFLEQSVRSLVDDGVLAGGRGAYRLETAVETVQVPATVQAILAARIDRLPPVDKTLLQTASVVGTDVPLTVLATVAGQSEDVLAEGLVRLQAAEFLYEARLFPDAEYTFKHALTHEVAYGSLLQDRRRTLHGRIVDAIEALYPDRRAEHVDRLAHHAVRGERWDKAADYLQRAGMRAADRSAHRAAVDRLEQALVAIERLPESRDRLTRGLDVRFDLHMSLFALSERARMRHHMEEAERVAIAIDDRHRLGRALSLLCPSLRVTGETRRSAEVGRRALSIATEVGDKYLEEDTSFWLGQTYSWLGDYRSAEQVLRRSITSLPVDLPSEVARALPHFASNARAWLASSLAHLGRFDEGAALGAEAIRVAQAADDKFRLIIAHHHLGTVHLLRGAFTESITLLERALSIGRTWDIDNYINWSSADLAVAYARVGRVCDALAQLGPGLERYALWRGEVYLRAGRLQEAQAAAEEGLAGFRHRGEQGLESWILHQLGEVTAASDLPDVTQADGYYRQALTLAEELSMRPLVAHCHLGLGKLHRRTGDHAKAQEHLTTAITMYREMGMAFWLEKARAASAARES